MKGYCLSCKKKRVMKNVRDRETKNGRRIKYGECNHCGNKMAKLVPN